MAGDDTVVMEWFYATPCGRCGHDIRIEKDPSRGKSRFSVGGSVTAKCTKCGHQDSYPSSAVDGKPFSAKD